MKASDCYDNRRYDKKYESPDAAKRAQPNEQHSVARTDKQVENAIKSTDKGTLNQRLNNLNADDLKRELQSNPQLAKQMANNKELMNKLNGIFGK